MSYVSVESSEVGSSGAGMLGQRITEDTPPDLLEGRMDLSVVIPGGKQVRMAVERR